jgi:TPR repeat protein
MPPSTSELRDLVRRAQGGDVDAQYSLAQLYHSGNGVPRNYLEAEKW